MYGIRWSDSLTRKSGQGEPTFQTREQAEKLIALIKSGLYKRELKRHKITWHAKFTVYQKDNTMKSGYDDISEDEFFKKHIFPQFVESDWAMIEEKCKTILAKGFSRFIVMNATEHYANFLYRGEYIYNDALDF